MLDILTIGDIKLDTFIKIPDASVLCQLKSEECKLCIDYGKKIPVESSLSQIAGTAPNVAVSLSKMRKKTAIISTMGKDVTYRVAIEFLKKHGVSTQFITTSPHTPSSFATVLNFRGESTQLVIHNGADTRLPAKFPQTKWLHLAEIGEGYSELFRSILRQVKARGIRLSFNPGQVQINERKKELFDLIEASEVLFLNLREARQLVRTTANADIRTVMEKIYRFGADDVVITDGRNGAYAYDGKRLYHCPMFPGKRIEATGAGDAFTSGFLGALLHEKNFDEALRWGSVNAASVVGYVGPTEGLLSHTEIMKRLKDRPSFTTKLLK